MLRQSARRRSYSRDEGSTMHIDDARERRMAPPGAAGGFGARAVQDISAALTALLADFFALYVKTKNFHWHISGPHFSDYHRMLDQQADQIFGTTDVIAERVR